MSIEEQISAARAKARKAQEDRVRAEASRDQAVAAEAQITEALRTEFGVSSLDEADRLLGRFESEIQAELANVSGHLGQVMP